MELAVEQYDQVLRYVDGEMSAAESNAFEAVLIQNAALQDEVAFYKEIRSLSESVERKIGNASQVTDDEQTDANELWMIKKARQDWENSYENDLRQKYGLPARDVKKVPPAEFHGLKRIDDSAQSAAEKGGLNRSVKEGKIKRMFRSGWLAAALFIGVILLIISFWNSRYDYSQVVVNNNTDSLNQKGEFQVGISAKKTDSLNRKDESMAGISAKKADSRDTGNNEEPSGSSLKMPSERIMQQLFVRNFEPDHLPERIPAPLEDPLTSYDANRSEEAIAHFKSLLAEIEDANLSDLTSRGAADDLKLITFYTHYYLAQSYLINNDMANALKEFDNADKKVLDKIWKVKIQWYKALAYLKIGRRQTAARLLEQIAQNTQNNAYIQKATNLIKELKKLAPTVPPKLSEKDPLSKDHSIIKLHDATFKNYVELVIIEKWM